MRILNGLYVKMMSQISTWKKEERGSQTLEWLGIAAVIVIIVGAVSTAFGPDGPGTGIGNTIKEEFEGLIEQIGGGGD